MAEVVTAASRYSSLQQARDPFLTRARDCAALTVPFIMPAQGSSSSTEFVTPYQSHGARGVRTLASKLLLSLFPNSPFFRYQMDDLALGQLKAQPANADTQRGQVEQALGARERAVVGMMEPTLMRPAAFTALQHLLVTGNYLIYIPPKEGRARGFRLDQYVVKRAPDGTLMEIVIQEMVSPGQLDPGFLAKIEEEVPQTDGNGRPVPSDTQSLELYTHVLFDPEREKWVVYQEVKGEVVPESEGEFNDGLCPYLPLRLSSQPNEDYGRSYVEEYLGDLDSLEGLSQAIVEGSAAAARVIFLVSPNGVTRLQVVAKAKNLDVVTGKAEDVTTLQVNKSVDLGIAKQQAESIARDLALAFLMNMSVQRSGERVTAEEIRYLASELDAALGGVYTLLAADFQLPVVRLLEARMEKTRKVDPLPKDLVSPVIVTGLEALGRGADQRNLKLFLTDVVQVLGPEQALSFLNGEEFLKRAGASYGIDMQGLIKTPEERAQEQAMAQQQAMIAQLGPNAINQAGGAIQQLMKGQAATEAAQAQASAQQGPTDG